MFPRMLRQSAPPSVQRRLNAATIDDAEARQHRSSLVDDDVLELHTMLIAEIDSTKKQLAVARRDAAEAAKLSELRAEIARLNTDNEQLNREVALLRDQRAENALERMRLELKAAKKALASSESARVELARKHDVCSERERLLRRDFNSAVEELYRLRQEVGLLRPHPTSGLPEEISTRQIEHPELEPPYSPRAQPRPQKRSTMPAVSGPAAALLGARGAASPRVSAAALGQVAAATAVDKRSRCSGDSNAQPAVSQPESPRSNRAASPRMLRPQGRAFAATRLTPRPPGAGTPRGPSARAQIVAESARACPPAAASRNTPRSKPQILSWLGR